MGSPEDKVNFLDDDLKTLPSTTALEEFEEDSNCPLTCLALAFLVIFGVFFGLVVFPSPRHGSYNEQGVFISQIRSFRFIFRERLYIVKRNYGASIGKVCLQQQQTFISSRI